MTQSVKINPEMLKWARGRAGLSIERAAKKAGLSDSASSTAVEKLEQLENGVKFPTFQQFLRFAKIYHQSPLVFSLSKPPVISDNGAQLEKMNLKITDEERGLLNALIVDIQTSQNLLKEIILEDEDFKPLEFVGSLSAKDGILQSAIRMKELLNISVEENWTEKFKTTAKLFEFLREKIEKIGVFVILKGNLGSYHSSISQSVFCGYVIADSIAPFIVINENDSVEAQVFTLIHEFALILIGQTKVNTPLNSFEISENSSSIEKFCTNVAGEFLLPVERIAFKGNPNNIEVVREFVEAVANGNQLGEPLVTRRLWQNGLISEKIQRSLLMTYSKQTQEISNMKSERDKELKGGPNYYVVKRHRLGNAIISLVRFALKSNAMTHTKAAIVLGTKPTSVDQILEI